MLQEGSLYLQLGFDHILDWQAYDHMLFVLVLCAGYTFSQWKGVLVLVTAFTIGHSITLALSALDIFRLDQDLVEALIPLTILLTALYNLIVWKPTNAKQPVRWEYLLALGFGFIHGMGFSNYFRALMSESESVVKPLLFFNLGIEIGQVVFVLVALSIASAVIQYGKLSQTYWTKGISTLVGIAAIYLMM